MTRAIRLAPPLRTMTIATFVALATGACSDLGELRQRYLGPTEPDPAVAAAIADGQGLVTGDYRVGPEDVLDISVWKEDSLKKEVLVRPDGGISFPLAGELHAAGLTTDQVRIQLVERLQKYIPDPVVSVSVLKASNYKVYVIGRVNKPGDYTTGRPIDVLQALSMAGGLTPFASENKIRVVRKTDGRELAIPFSYGHVQRGEDLEQNIILKSGDVVVVP
jgi:polysaccharide export outer membrane protein